MEFHHFSHDHPLTITFRTEEDALACSACKAPCSSLTCSCSSCNFHLHRSCARLLIEFQPMFPPHHSLITPDSQHVLDHPYEFVARTKPCRNNLDDESLLQNQNDRKDDQEQGQLFCCACHKPLELIRVPNTTLCYICNKVPSAYICAPCPSGLINFFDRRCAELPKEIHYPYHPHRLSMRIRKNSICHICGKSCRAFNYGCDGCNFTVDIKCTLKEMKKYEGPLTSVRRFMGLVQDL